MAAGLKTIIALSFVLLSSTLLDNYSLLTNES